MREGWNYHKLGEICEFITGLWTGKKPPYITVGVIRNTNFTKDCNLDDRDIAYISVEEKSYLKKKLKKGDIIVEKSGGSDKQPVGRAILFDLDGDFSFSNFTTALRIKDINIISPQYLHKILVAYYMRGETKAMQSNTTGIRNLDFTRYKTLAISIPSASVQKSIVAELDKLNEILSKKREQLKELDCLAQAIFYDMFGDPILNEKGWEMVPFNYVGTFGRGVSKHRPRNAEELLGGTMPLIQTGDVARANMYITQYVSTYSELGVAQSKVWKPGTLCITIAATIGKCAILTFDACFPDSVVGFIANSKVRNEYIYYIFGCIQTILEENAPAVAQKNINLATLNALNIPLPPLNIQKKFADKISEIDKQKQKIKQSIIDVQQLLDYTMNKYFG